MWEWHFCGRMHGQACSKIKQPCLQLTNCSFKKAQSGSENAPPLPSVPAAASASRQADFSFPESLFADAGSAETDSFSVWQGDFGSFLLQWGHGTPCLFYTRVQMLLRNISRLVWYQNSCSVFGMQPGIQAAHQKPSIFSLAMTLFVSVSSSLPVSSILALSIASLPCLSLSASCRCFSFSHSHHPFDFCLLSSLLDSLFILESFIQKKHTHIHTNVNDVLLINRIWMKKKKIFWYLVFTSILGAKYCDKVPLPLASSGAPAEVQLDCQRFTIIKSAKLFTFSFFFFFGPHLFFFAPTLHCGCSLSKRELWFHASSFKRRKKKVFIVSSPSGIIACFCLFCFVKSLDMGVIWMSCSYFFSVFSIFFHIGCTLWYFKQVLKYKEMNIV